MTPKGELQRRIEKLEAQCAEPTPDLVGLATPEEWRALAILRHELDHKRGAEITPELWAEVERRMTVGSGS